MEVNGKRLMSYIKLRKENKAMKLADLIQNANFDVNCNYKIYYDVHNDGGTLLYSSDEPTDYFLNILLNRDISYITVVDNTLIIETD